MIEERYIHDPHQFKLAMRGYDDAVREWQDRERERSASRWSQEVVGQVKYPTTYDIDKIARSFEHAVDIDAVDFGLDELVIHQRMAGKIDPIAQAARLIREVQKTTGHDATAMVAGVLFLEDNGYPYASEAIDDVRLATVIQKMKTAEADFENLRNVLEHDLTEGAEQKPDFRFVFYKGQLEVRDWDHNLRFRDMIRALLGEHGKHLEDQDVMDDEIATGDVWVSGDAIDIKLESLADNDVQNLAVNSVQQWARSVNLIGPIKTG
jgi:hypothetical protein